MSVRYGNLPLGQVSKLLVSIIGRDAALTIADEQGIPIIGKDLDRMSGEKEGSFIHLRPSEKTSIYELYRVFSGILEKEYGFSSFVYTLVVLFFTGTFKNALRGNGTQPRGNDSFILLEGGLIPYEMPTSKLTLLLLNWSLGYLGIGYENKDTHISKESVFRLLDDTYQIVFDEIIKKTAKNNEDFYKKLGDFYEKKYPNSKKLPDFKQTIKRYCQGSSDITWKTLKLILDFVYSKDEKELVYSLIGLYFLKNTETALKEVCGIEQKDIYQIKQDIRLWAQDKLPSEPQSESQCFLMTAGKYNLSDLSLLQRDFIDPDFHEQIEVIQKCSNYLWGINPIKHDRAEQLIREMDEKCPHCGIFFVSWARARLAVLSCKFDGSEEDKHLQKQALEGYHTAFDKGRNFAGAYLKTFLEEIIATTVYFNRKETKKIPDVIDDDKEIKEDKVPITIYAKQYYEYGYVLNLFEQESSETFFLHFHARAHFWNVFPVLAFVYNETVRQYKFAEEMLKARWFYHFFENVYDQNLIEGSFESIKHTKALQNRTNDSINDRMNLFPGHDIQYTPLSIALMTRQLSVVEDYLGRFANTLDETKINTDGSTALLEAVFQYKLIRFLNRQDENALLQARKYKEIILKLIKRSPFDALYAETVTDYISVLEEAINTFDIGVVKAIVEKKGFDIQSLKISADQFSPLYYAIMRCYFVSNLIFTEKISEDGKRNINWEKLNVPGIFTEDRKAYYENMTSDPLWETTEKQSIYMFCGKPEIWKQELSELKEIVEYLADKTDDVDAFAKEAPDGGHTTALSLAVESDFDDICRLLIEKGANPAYTIRNKGMLYDSHLFRAAWFKSWKTLEMLLTDFRDKIRPIINERYREDKQTVAHLLFRVDYGHIYQYSVNNENFKIIDHFIPLFHKVGVEFDIPDIRNITVRQILREKNLEYLAKIQEKGKRDGENITKPSSFLYFPNSDSYSRLNDLSYFSSEKPSIKSVRVRGTFSDLSPLTLLPNMEELDIINNNYIHDITPLASLVNLKKLTLVMCDNIESIKPISSLVNLKYLNIDYDDTYYEELAALRNLEYLDLSTTSYPGMEEIDVVHVAKLSLLKELHIKAGLFHADYLGRIRNINLLENLVNLEVLSFHNVAPDISWITGLKKLKKFEINYGYIEDLRPLLELPGLVEVNLAFSEIKDISVLLESKTIKKVTGPRLWDNELLARFAKKGIEYEESYSDR